MKRSCKVINNCRYKTIKHQRDKQIFIVYLAGVKLFRFKEAY